MQNCDTRFTSFLFRRESMQIKASSCQTLLSETPPRPQQNETQGTREWLLIALTAITWISAAEAPHRQNAHLEGIVPSWCLLSKSVHVSVSSCVEPPPPPEVVVVLPGLSSSKDFSDLAEPELASLTKTAYLGKPFAPVTLLST